MPSVQFGNTTIPFTLKRKSNKQVSITVTEEGSVEVVAPKDAPIEKVLGAVKRKGAWIRGKKALVRERVMNTSTKEFISGEGFTYLGKTYRLKIHGTRVVLKDGTLFAPSENIEESVLSWYKEKALQKFRERTKKWTPLFPTEPSSLLIGDQKTRWGSCDKEGTLRINWRVILAPLRVVDYVIAHELTHLKYHGHGKEFWTLLESVMPDYVERKDWLRVNGDLLRIN